MICLTLSTNNLIDACKEVELNAKYIDLVELRLDCLLASEVKQAYKFPSMIDFPVILTHRRKQDGGFCTLSEKERRTQILNALEGEFSYVDIEDDIKKNDIVIKAKEKGIKVIRSFHDFNGVTNDIYSKITQLAARGDIAKIAVTPKGINDTIKLFKIAKEVKDVEKIIIGMGEYGLATRILYKKLGSILTFSSSFYGNSLSHVSPKDLKEVYRSDMVNDNTAIYGIIGNPVNASLSPYIHNPGFHAIRYNAIYLPFLVDDVRSFFTFAEMLRMRGFSVTVPHKLEVLSRLGNISREVKQIGSCNTVVRMPNLWKGVNTDYYGFLSPIEDYIKDGKIKNALVIGAGGASYAIVWALRNKNIKVTIINRTLSKAEQIAKINICSYDSLENVKNYENKVDLIVQSTTVGQGENNENPIEGFKFSGKEIAYDIVYRPKLTPFLKEAKKAGCTLFYGEDMLFSQGKLQFEYFTGYHYPKTIKLN